MDLYEQGSSCITCGAHVSEYDGASLCTACGETACDSCIMFEGEDGSLCLNCGTECTHCDVPMLRCAANSEHMKTCVSCGKHRCVEQTKRLCCNSVCSDDLHEEEEEEEEKGGGGGSLSCFELQHQFVQQMPCGRLVCSTCREDTVAREPCCICNREVCDIHLNTCRGPDRDTHTYCNNCAVYDCGQCLSLRCPRCPPHEPWDCLLLTCPHCTPGVLCQSHRTRRCPCCAKQHGRSGFCPDCRLQVGLVMQRLLVTLREAPDVVSLVRSFVGVRYARSITQLNSLRRLPVVWRTTQAWHMLRGVVAPHGSPPLFGMGKVGRGRRERRGRRVVAEEPSEDGLVLPLPLRVLGGEFRARAASAIMQTHFSTVEQCPPVKRLSLLHWAHAFQVGMGAPCAGECGCREMLQRVEDSVASGRRKRRRRGP